MKKTLNKHNNLYIVENNIENCKYIEIEKLEKLKESYNNFYSNKSDNKFVPYITLLLISSLHNEVGVLVSSEGIFI